MPDDDWDEQMRRLDERTAKRRAKLKDQDEAIQQELREAGERQAKDGGDGGEQPGA